MPSTQRVLSGSRTRGSSGGSNRFRQGVSVRTMQQLRGGVTPKLRSGARPIKLINGRLIVDNAQHFNEAIEVPAQRLIHDSTKSTTTMGGHRGGAISFVPNPEIEQRDFGIPQRFNPGVPFEDVVRFNPVAYMSLSGSISGSLMYPRVLDNISMRDPRQSDGAIEPLTIRDGIGLSSTYSPFEAHGVYGFWCNGAETSRRRSNPILQQIDLELPALSSCMMEPYEDGGAGFMGMTLAAAVNIPGFLHNSLSVFSPWKESTDVQLAYAELLEVPRFGTVSGSYSPSGGLYTVDYSMYNILLQTQTSGSFEDLNDRHHKSATAGFIFINAIDGTDSLAFGGLKK